MLIYIQGLSFMVKDDDDDDDELGFSDMPSQVDEEDQEMAQDSKN